MTSAQENRQQAEITRLVELAQRRGSRDSFCGKRRWPRYQLGLRLEVAPHDDPTDIRTGHLYNVSAGGFGFRFDDELPATSRMRVREWSPDAPRDWIFIRVRHCSRGLSGFLVGAEYDPPLSGASRPSAASTEVPAQPVFDDGPGHLPATHAGRRPRSLRAECAGAAAAGGALGVALAVFGLRQLWPAAATQWLPLCAALGAFGFSGVGAWLVARRESRYMARLARQIRELVTGPGTACVSRAPSSAEFEIVSEACSVLREEWSRQSERERAQRERLESLDVVKSGVLDAMVQNLGGPLDSIRRNARMLQAEIASLDADGQRQLLRAIESETAQLVDVIGGLANAERLHARRGANLFERRDLAATITSAAESFGPVARAKAIRFQLDCPAPLPEVEADADQIRLVVRNLLSNAFEFTARGGTVQMAVDVGGGELVLRVADSGPGIERGQWDQIFESLHPANRADDGSLGLGLYTVRRIVEGHDGVVWLESEPGQGCEFFVSLPLATVRKPRDASAGDGRRLHIIVCDSDAEFAARSAQVLRRERHDVRVAHCGQRLIEQLTESRPQVVVTDLLLPDMDAARLLQALGPPEERAFGLVLHTFGTDVAQVQASGADCLLNRPASRRDLLHAVGAAAGRATARPAARGDAR